MARMFSPKRCCHKDIVLLSGFPLEAMLGMLYLSLPGLCTQIFGADTLGYSAFPSAWIHEVLVDAMQDRQTALLGNHYFKKLLWNERIAGSLTRTDRAESSVVGDHKIRRSAAGVNLHARQGQSGRSNACLSHLRSLNDYAIRVRWFGR